MLSHALAFVMEDDSLFVPVYQAMNIIFLLRKKKEQFYRPCVCVRVTSILIYLLSDMFS